MVNDTRDLAAVTGLQQSRLEYAHSSLVVRHRNCMAWPYFVFLILGLSVGGVEGIVVNVDAFDSAIV